MAMMCLVAAPVCSLVFLFGLDQLPVAVTDLSAWLFLFLLPTGLLTFAVDALLDYRHRLQAKKD
jgi:hypothetical protein